MKSALRVEKIFKHKCYSSKMNIDNDMIKLIPKRNLQIKTLKMEAEERVILCGITNGGH